jgi:iron complex outermembrane recepter protein
MGQRKTTKAVATEVNQAAAQGKGKIGGCRRYPLALAVVSAISAMSQAAYAASDDATSAATATAAAPADPVVLPAVSVTGSSAADTGQHLDTRVDGGALGTRSQLDTPFSTTVVDRKQLDAYQPTKLGDVFMGDASVTDNSDTTNAWANRVSVRGLSLDWANAYYIDGVPFDSYGVTMPYEMFQRVELLKGLSGFMYGFASPGGIINFVMPVAPDKPVRSIDVGFSSNSLWTEHADLSQRFGPNQMFGARVNATHESGGLYNDGHLNRNSVSLALDAQLTKDLSADFKMLDQRRTVDGIESSIQTFSYTGSILPTPINADSPQLNSRGESLTTAFDYYRGRVVYRLAPEWTASLIYGYGTSTRNRDESSLALLNAAGDYTDNRYYGHEGSQSELWQAMLNGTVHTGPFTHQLVFGAQQQTHKDYYEANDFYGAIGTGNIYTQNTNAWYPTFGANTTPSDKITQKVLFASDTIQLTQRWSLLAGLRYTDYAQDSYTNGVVSSQYNENGVLTPTAALMYKLDPSTTIYASYVESLEPGSLVTTPYANAGSVLNPLRSRQYELGIKTAHESWSATAALFRIERGSTYANDQNVYVQDGQTIYEGFEMGAAANLTNQWNIAGSLQYLDTWYAKGSAYNGQRAVGAPRWTLAAHVGYTPAVLSQVEFALDSKYTGNVTLRPDGSLYVPGYMLFNLGATYRTKLAGHDATFRLALDNVFNRNYWEYQTQDYIRPGDPRILSLSAKFAF